MLSALFGMLSYLFLFWVAMTIAAEKSHVIQITNRLVFRSLARIARSVLCFFRELLRD